MREFPICEDHRTVDWNQPALDDNSCVLCRLFYLEAQESLLEEWQQRTKRAEDAISEIQRPLDAQMARLNATVERLNVENGRLERELADKEEALSEVGDRLLGWRKRALKAEATQSASVPTTEMCGAPRYFIAYCETPGRTLEGARMYMQNCGVSIDSWPAWAHIEKGHITKSAVAAIVWHMMEAVRGKSDG